MVDNYAKQIMEGQLSGGKCRVCSGVTVSSLLHNDCDTKACKGRDMKLAAATSGQQ